MTRPLKGPAVKVSGLLAVLADSRLSIADRAGAYAVLHQIQLRINRALRGPVRDEIVRHLVLNAGEDLGPVSLKASAVGVAWPCNDPGNWLDSGVQDALMELHEDPETRPYVRRIPLHYEIDTAALGRALVEDRRAARKLWEEMRAKGWRTEEARRLSLAVREAYEVTR